VAELANDFENLGDNIAYAIIQMAKLIDKLSVLTSSPSFKPALLLLGAAGTAITKNPAPFLSAFGTVGAMGVGSALTSQRKLSPEENITLAKARVLNRRLEEKIIALTNGKRKEEYDLLKKKTALDKLKEKFDVELIGLQKARNEATDEETKRRLDGLIAIKKNDEALAIKALAELDAAAAAQLFAKNFNIALESIRTMTDKINDFIKSQVGSFDDALASVKSLNKRITDMINSIGGPSTAVTTGPSGPSYSPVIVQAAIDDTKELNSRINDFLSGFSSSGTQRSSSQAPMDIRLTIDGGSDKLSQAIAESIQVATRSGYSTVPAGFLV
jgi:hypothetical protein